MFYGAVLSLRGAQATPQPLQDDDGVLCFNGEIYDGLELTSQDGSDSEALLKAFGEIESLEDFLQILGKLRGPWAFCYLCSRTNKLYFGRDIFGRRSLLLKKTCCGFQLTSVAYPKTATEMWEEVPARGLYIYELDNSSYTLVEWERSPTGLSGLSFAPCTVLENAIILGHKIATPISAPLKRDLEGLELLEGDLSKQYEILTQRFYESIRDFKTVFQRAIATRIENISARHSDQPIGILFSGGIDSVMITALAIEAYPDKDFDLINVSFEHTNLSIGANTYDSPDRLNCVIAFEELRSLGGRLKLIFVDVSLGQMEEFKEEIHIPRLIYPMNTVLDCSIGLALWFAARGKGYDFHTKEPYQSPAKILFVGMGADEQLGGYSRHAASFKDRDWSKLQNCIAEDIDRISWRNLGRDDRVISDLGRESRAPFLDENLVSFLNSLPIPLKMQLHHSRGVGDKLILRLLAHSIGLRETAMRAKRAMQFGSRVVNSDNKKAKGSLPCNW